MTTPAADWVDEALADRPNILTTKEACATIRTSPRNLYRLIAKGQLHAVRQAETGASRLLIPKSSVARYLRNLGGG